MDTAKLTNLQEQVLREQVIDDTHPGWLLHDFQAVLDFLGTEGVKSSGKYHVLPMTSFEELNKRLGRPLRLTLARPKLKSNPYLMGLNLLLRASGLACLEGAGAKTRLALDPVLFAQWQALNPTERYFNLLEAWLLNGRAEMVGESGRGVDGFFSECLSIWWSIEKRIRFGPPPAGSSYLPGIGGNAFNLALMDLFGLLKVEHPSAAVPTWYPANVRHTPFGDALRTLLGGRGLLPPDEFYEESDGPGTFRFGRLQPRLQPYFPEWRANLEPRAIESREGVFIFKVSLGKVWRRIAAPAEITLDDLVLLILESVDFDDDHFYEFEYRDRFGVPAKVMHPECNEGPLGHEVSVGELPLEPGQSMTLTYDFGDNWRFDVKLEQVDPPDNAIKSPRVLERHGEAPKQYEYDDY
ncbi:MAG: plasmid pRiA4b ORF-3 family protein [Isosphaeraceae bacterium]|nr:plasmid pRiA4b ORF-3 family protein [Isosphaeraceae bacterium]